LFLQGLAFALTLVVELPLIGLAARRWNIALSRALAAGAIASGISHPVAWTAALPLGPEEAAAEFIAIEAAVILFEAAVLALIGRFGWIRGAGASLAANTASALAGLVLLG